jgi:hypothetical protein
MFAHTDRAAMVGVFLSLCSLELFRNLEPFKSSSTNLLAYIAQYVVLLTFAAALVLEAGIGEGLSNIAIGSFKKNVYFIYFFILTYIVFVCVCDKGFSVSFLTNTNVLSNLKFES